MTNKNQVPIMVSVLLAFGAWMSCLMIILCFGFSAFQQSLIPGVIYTLFAALLAHSSEKAQNIQAVGKAFMVQLSLAFSLVGKTLLVMGLTEIFNFQIGGIFLLTSLLAVASYRIFSQKMDRILTVAAAGFTGMAYLAEYTKSAFAMEWVSVVLFLLAYVLFLLKKENLRPLAWGLMLVSSGPLMMFFYDGKNTVFSGFSHLLLGGGFALIYIWQVRHRSSLVMIGLMLFLCYLTNTGSTAGLALVSLGFIQKNLYQKVWGVFIFAAGFVWLYYNMQTTLLIKSYYLMGVGLLLLGVYAWLRRGENAC
ncbi:MAG: DUF4401 domain-containing protein [Elusimicrobiaceae bacterium]|nr:DUF4401 domain-containing protein [Elusimicrobiaceae bacterium]